MTFKDLLNWALDYIGTILNKTTRTKLLLTLAGAGLLFYLGDSLLVTDAQLSVVCYVMAGLVIMAYCSAQSPIDVEAEISKRTAVTP